MCWVNPLSYCFKKNSGKQHLLYAEYVQMKEKGAKSEKRLDRLEKTMKQILAELK
jgi:hypothetical protein